MYIYVYKYMYDDAVCAQQTRGTCGFIETSAGSVFPTFGKQGSFSFRTESYFFFLRKGLPVKRHPSKRVYR